MRLILIILATVLLSGTIIYFSAPIIKEFRRSQSIEREIDNLRAEADKIEMENDGLREKIEYLKSTDYKERVAKDRLNLRNPGEKVVVIQPETGKDDDANDNHSDEFKVKNAEYADSNGSNQSLTLNGSWSNLKKWYEFLFAKHNR